MNKISWFPLPFSYLQIWPGRRGSKIWLKRTKGFSNGLFSKFQTPKNIFLAASLFPNKPVVRFLMPGNWELSWRRKPLLIKMIILIMMTKLLEEKSKNCRRRNILQRDELIRKEVVRGTLLRNTTRWIYNGVTAN